MDLKEILKKLGFDVTKPVSVEIVEPHKYGAKKVFPPLKQPMRLSSASCYA